MSTITEPSAPAEAPAPPPPEIYAFPATPQEQQLWFLDSLYLGNPAYNIPLAYEVSGPLNAGALDESLRYVVNRHENLRTTFAMREDEFLQLVEPELTIRFRRLDLSGLTPTAREQARTRAIDEEGKHRFNLTHGPLVRGTLIILEPARHVVMFNFHHIILDHLSVLQFAREFGQAYAAYSRGGTPALEPPSLQYPDFSVWQEERFAEEGFKADLQDWISRLEGAPVETSLPFDRPRGATQTFAGREVKFSLSAASSTRIREFARSARKSVFVTLLTAFKCLLARYSGQNDILVGSPFANRTVGNLDGVMGCCMNTLPLRSQLGANGTFAEALDTVHQTVLTAYQRQRVPLKLIVDQARLERDASRNPLFQSTFIVQDPPMALALEGLEVTPLEIHNDTAKFDLAVWMWESGGLLSGVWEYNTDLFDADTIDRMIRNFETLATNAASAPQSPWRTLGLLSPEEHAQVVDGFNRTNTPYPAESTVVDLVAKSVQAAGDAIALEFGREQLTYRDLARQADLLTQRLQAMGVGSNSLVGLYLDRSPAMVSAMLAVLQSGAAYVPLDPAFPAERIQFMIEDSGASVIVCQSALAHQLPAHQARTLLVDEPATSGSASPPRSKAQPAALAYVRYTSGSTGRPKGVEIGHQALVNFLLAMQREPGFTREDVLLAVTTLSFDISELEIWLPLISGGRIILASRQQVADGPELIRLLRDHGVTTMQATPATWRLLLEAGWPGDRRLSVLCGGEALPADLAQRLLGKCRTLWNMYGPTETTVWSSVLEVRAGEPIRVGRPIANTQFYIVDPANQPVPLGVHGELLIGGDGLARGYLRRPELTQDRFVASPFQAGRRLYRTGDLVKLRRDGTLDFIGRIDSQVKLRGYRIELGEIESALAQVPGVAHAVVIVRDEQLVAYYVGQPGQSADVSACREALRARLPEYMVPALYLKLDALPLTPNGKVDRKALPSPDTTTPAATGEYVAPRNAVEQQLAGIWEQVLKRSPIGVHDNFFDLGGHSLLAVNLFSRVENTFGRRLPLASLFQHPSVAQLATLLKIESSPSQSWQALVPIREGGDRPALFIVHGAGGNILIYRSLAHHLAPGVPVYGLQSLGLDGVTKPLLTIEEMAAAYVEEILQKQPSGPYNLAGYCMGGKVAFEIARILEARGHRVELLALLDSYNFVSAVRVSKLSLYRQMIGFHLRNVFELGPVDAASYVAEKLRMLVEYAGSIAKASFTRARLILSGGNQQAPIEHFIQKLNDHAGEIYIPQPYSGRVSLFKPQRNYSTFSDPNMGWRDVSQGELEMVRLELNPHAMLVEPYVRKLAEAINARLPGGAR